MVAAALRFSFIGSGPQLIACAERALGRGHRLAGIASDCPQVRSFCERRGIARIPLSGDVLGFLRREPYDVLCSVVHHAIVSPALLATAGLDAVNYHDSLLPQLAGFNATSHALLEGKSRHGVTWHRMTDSVDGGALLVQRSFEIGEDDTAFTLSVRCSEAGTGAFDEVLDGLEQGKASGTPQPSTGRSFHLRSERPDVALLDLSKPAAELHRFVRALNLGPDDNWMAKPKLWLGERVICATEARLAGDTKSAAGSVLAVGPGTLTVATGAGALQLSELQTVDGAAADLTGLREGTSLPSFAQLERVRELDLQYTKHERFWLKRLERVAPPRLPWLAGRAGATRWVEVERSAPAETLVAALAALVMRSAEGEAFDLGLAREQELPAFYASVLPLHFESDPELSFAALREHVRTMLGEQAAKGSYARDMVLRYRALREHTQPTLPITVRMDGVKTLAEGAALTLVTGDQGYTWVHDGRLVSAERLFARFEVLLAHALAAPETALSRLPLLPEAERALLVDSWQDTRVPYQSDACVHTLFEAQVDRTPDAKALSFQGRTLSYRELDQRANKVAHALRARGVGPDVLVGLCIERSLEMVIGLLGVLKAGGAYVPLDPVYPRERIAMMLEDAKAPVLLTQASLSASLPGEHRLSIESLLDDATLASTRIRSEVAPGHLAYVIFTSGSTGRPKGVMIQHGNVSNFFTGMDRALAHDKPGRWLAVTSISFDISVLELFWTLSRGFEVVLQGELDRASLSKPRRAVSTSRMGFGLFYFAASTGSAQEANVYKLLLDGARFADTHGFDAVWTPERHFHEFGGLYPSPAVTTAALATITKHISLRAGSIVLPLHNPLRVAEDWAVIDQLCGGRVGLSFASGWHANDFAFMPHHYERRREVMLEGIETVRKLWRGEKVSVINGNGQPIEVAVLPRPFNANPPVWVASAGNVETFAMAGRQGFNVLTNMLGQDIEDLRNKLRAYREARREAGYEGDGIVTVMLHTYVCEDTEKARRLARKPFSRYLASSFDLVKVAPWMFPAFRQPSKAAAQDPSFDPSVFTPEDMEALLDHAFDRYFDTAGLFGAPEHALEMVEQLKEIGANEVACLIDFGIETEEALHSLVHLDRLRQLANPEPVGDLAQDWGIGAQLARGGITHLQCTPSMARMLLSDPEARAALRGVKKLMLGGEALPRELADELLTLVGGEIINMYGPTETTVWSTTSPITSAPITIGRPIANTFIRILDAQRQLLPIGAAGELCIGGAGVVRGYLDRAELTAERFVPDPLEPSQRIYRTGDLARFREDGELEFLGRLDHQVKISGYRIELGEIENALARHPRVRQNVVVARNDAGATQLVAYLIANQSGSANPGQRVEQWKSLWDETYRLATHERDQDPRFNIAGWRDSFTGELIPAPEMREWLDHTLELVLAGKPRRVLEIGCGTGMILFGSLPHVERYTAVDVSPHALETIRRELKPDELAKVTLVNQAAHELADLQGGYDTVVVNSVAQYFPDQAYLTAVLKRASELTAEGGRIVVGDVRNLAHLRAFHTRAELTQAPATRSVPELTQRIERRLAHEGELLLAESYFAALPRSLSRIAAVDVQLKRGAAHNEMACFRFDVTLFVGVAPPRFPLPAPSQAVDGQPVAYLRDLPNARLTGIYGSLAALQAGVDSRGDARDGVQPESLALPDYDVSVYQARSGDPARFDVVYRHRQRGPEGLAGLPPLAETQLANQPVREAAGDLEAELREHLRAGLPEYMIPSLFVQLSAFPLTPNQKIDRKALPAPERAAARAAEAQVPAKTDLERQIAGVWQTVLNLEQVGRNENIFDLGANSLLTVQAANRLSSLLGKKVSLVSMFRFPTVAALSEHLGVEAEPRQAEARQVEEQKDDRRKDAAERRRQLRAERAAQGARHE
jgi:natural product biosynthesis luciferase-like monooxygenase protein